MVQVDFSYEAASASRIIDRILDLLSLPIIPDKKIIRPNFNLPTVSDEIDSEIRLVQVSLDADPAFDSARGLDDHAVSASGGALLLVARQRPHAVLAISPRGERDIELLYSANRGAIR